MQGRSGVLKSSPQTFAHKLKTVAVWMLDEILLPVVVWIVVWMAFYVVGSFFVSLR